MKIERRFLHELRADSQGDEMSLVGYASKFGVKSEDLGGFRETVMPGAFARSIREGADVKFLMNHDPSLVMGRTKNKTLTLSEDGTGLKFRVVLPNTQAARDLHTLVKRGDIDQCSFAFTVDSQNWTDERDENGDMYASRQLMDVDLMDVSAVTYPAYNDTEVNARMFSEGALVEVRSAVRDIENKRAGADVSVAQENPEDPGLKAAKGAKTSDEHSKAADFHKKAAGSAKKAGDAGKALAHLAAAGAHDEASKAQKDAFGKAAKAGAHDATDSDKKAAASAMEYSAKATQSAQGSSSETSWRTWNVAELRGSESQPPKLSPIDLPQPFCDEAKEDWWNAFYDAYDSIMKKGGRGYAIKEAIGKAIAAANQNVQPATETPDGVAGGKGKNPTSVKGDIVDTDGDGDAAQWERSARRHAESRYSEGTFEDRIEDINCALKEKFGLSPSTSGMCWPGSAKYWVLETYEEMVIVCSYDEGGGSSYYCIQYVYDKAAEDGDKEIIFGEPKKVEQTWVPSERALKTAEERAKAARRSAEDVSDPDSPDYDPSDPEYDEALDSSSERFDQAKGEKAFAGEDRDGAKTKKVAGKALGSGDFAFVGDSVDPSTWKLPVHDESHAKNALARFNQTKGIPAEKKDEVWKRIVAACKKFGVDVSEQDSLRCAMPHAVAQEIMSDGWDDGAMHALRAKLRTIEIDLS